MISTLWRYSLRSTARRPVRSLLTLLGITIGVATVVAVSLTTHTMRGIYDRAFSALIGRASLEVTAAGASGFDEGLHHRIEQLPEIVTAVNVVQIGASMMTRDGPTPVTMLGIDPERDPRVRVYEFLQGEMLVADTPGLLIGQSLSNTYNIGLGDEVRLVSAVGYTSWPVRGILKPTSAAGFNGGAIVFVPLRVAQQRLKMGETVNAIHVVPNDAMGNERAQVAIHGLLPEGVRVQTARHRGELARDAVVNLEQILSTLSIVSLVAGAFVILNTFRMTLEERRQQLAVLRALGATSAQVTRLLLREGLVYGCVGTALGVALGFGIAHALRPGMGLIYGLQPPTLAVTAEPFVLAVLLGPSATLIAAYLPARRAGRRVLLPDLLSRRDVSEAKERVWPRYVGLGLLAVAGLVDGLFVLGWLPLDQARGLLPLAMVGIVAGAVLSLPWVLSPITRCVSAVIVRVFSIEGQLSIRESERHASRTSLTVGVLTVAIMITVGPGNAITSAMDNLYRWFDTVVGHEFFVFASAADAGFSFTPVTVPESFAQEIAQLPSIQKVSAANFVTTRVKEKMALVIAAEHTEDKVTLAYTHDTPTDAHQKLCRGDGVAIGTNLAQRLQLDIGDLLELPTEEGLARQPVVGKVTDYYVGGMTIHMSRSMAVDVLDVEGAHMFAVVSRDGYTEKATVELEAFCGEHGLLLQSFADLRLDLENRLAESIRFLWTMMGLVFVVASLAIMNTLTMNVLDQVRELGVLRAIGMQRAQIRKMVLAQATAIGLISLAPGIAAGLTSALAMTLPAEYLTGHRLPFEVHPRIVCFAVVAAIGVTSLAAWFPAQYATRLPIVRAIQWE